MPEINIAIEVPVEDSDIDKEKLLKFVKKVAKAADKSELDIIELGAAISLLQDHYIACYGALPMSGSTFQMIKGMTVLSEKED